MRGVMLGLLVSLVAVGVAWAAEPDPREVIAQAIAARGGKEVVGRRMALHLSMKGQLFFPGAGGGTVRADLYRSPGLGEKSVIHVSLLGMTLTTTSVHNGDKGWEVDNQGNFREMTAEELAAQKQDDYCEQMSGLTHLLEDRAFTLAALPGARVNGRAAHGVMVRCKGQPDVRLFFDKESRLLVQLAYTPTIGPSRGKRQEVNFTDYREVGDLSQHARVLAKAGVSVETKALLAYLRKRVPDPKAGEQARKLVAQLGADDFEEREQAQEGLLALGKAAVPELERAAKSSDVEVARRAKECLTRLEVGDDSALVKAAVRHLVARGAAGTARALLDLLPGSEETLAEEIRAGLVYLAGREGPSVKELQEALADKDPIKRAAAGALGKDGGKYRDRPGRLLYLPGFTYPMKQIYYQDGQKVMEARITQLTCYNALAKTVFARPK